MRILYIYRSKDSGPSIRRVFEPIENALKKECQLDSIYLPRATASPIDLFRNIQFVKNYIRGKQYDIIHITGHVNYLIWPLRKYRTIVTVHDLGFYTNFASGLKKKLLYLFFIHPLKYAKHITYISDKSYEEACDCIKLPESKQSIIYNPVDPSFVFSPKNINKEKPIILHLGTKPNKNLSRVIEAVSTIHCTLHIIGNVSENLLKKIDEYGIDVRIDNNVSDEEIIRAYKECDIVSFPSLYEGFGLPIIEGQAIGRPIVTSNLLPMNRIAGKGAVLVDPYSVDSIKVGFLKAIKEHSEYITKGRINVEKYSLGNIVNQYIHLYKKMLD